MAKLRIVVLSAALAYPLAAPAMGLMPRDEGRTAWESLQPRVLETLGGSCKPVNQPAERVPTASTPSVTREEL